MSKHRADVEPDQVPTTIAEPVPPSPLELPPAVEQAIERILETKLGHFVADIERRYAMALEVEAGGRTTIHAPDLNTSQHLIEGYTVTANSPSGGSIAWTSVHIVYNGVDYTIADANTANKYVWFVKPGSYTPGTPVTLQTSNTQPTLATGDTMVFINNAGTPVSALEAGGVAPAVGPASVGSTAIVTGAVGTTALADDAVTNAKIGPLAVGTTEIASGAVGSTQLGAGAVTPTRLNILSHVMF